MSWEKSSYTKAGAALLSESLSGGALTITRAASGTGSVDTDLSAETAVSGDTHELSLLGNVVTGKYKVDKRMMLQADIIRENQATETFHCLNDAVVTRGDYARLIDVNIHCEERPVWDVRADGVIVSTPTGSTAYSMAAGGPVVSPETDCFVVTSICPHSLIDRSIVFPSSKALYVRVQNDVDNNSIFTADGKRPVQIDGRTVVRISKSPYVARLIKVKPDNFYEILRKKIIER